MIRFTRVAALGFPLLAGSSCIHMTHELEQKKPLEINVNVRLQVDQQLEDFFAFQNRPPAGVPATKPAAPAAPATQPTAQS
jgi:hypothetical protein